MLLLRAVFEGSDKALRMLIRDGHTLMFVVLWDSQVKIIEGDVSALILHDSSLEARNTKN